MRLSEWLDRQEATTRDRIAGKRGAIKACIDSTRVTDLKRGLALTEGYAMALGEVRAFLRQGGDAE